jgi:hypothetical protein
MKKDSDRERDEFRKKNKKKTILEKVLATHFIDRTTSGSTSDPCCGA